ncbi:MAG TPA: PAS domain S-box protein [Xanthobacteraceae bacterium]|jgi:PAS domain S-box-containing protein
MTLFPRNSVASDLVLNRGGNAVENSRVSTDILFPSLDVFCRRLIQEAPDAIIYADVGGMIRFWNEGAERIFGFSRAEAIGRSLDLIIPENLRKRHWDPYAETMRTGQTRYGAGDVLAVPATRKGGTRVSIEFSILPLRDHEGRMVGVAAILRDVTKRFEEMKTLRNEIAALRKRMESR